MSSPKVLVFDIETSPSVVYTFGIRKQYIGVNQIKEDTFLMSVAAKWINDSKNKVMYRDQSKAKDPHDDKALCEWIRELIDEADIVVTKNGKMFDVPYLMARWAFHRIPKPGPHRHYDIGVVAQQKFGFTSSKLEYLTSRLCPELKKLSHKNFPGMELWIECLRGNPSAWKEMKLYNGMDVLGTEALYNHLSPYDPQINFSVYSDDEEPVCQCGSKDLRFKGYYYTNTSKQKCWRCNDCGAYWRDRKNLLAKKTKQNLRLPVR